ncbi:hypothetical protein U1707_14465 [Sphingomonas sp. PB2P12]|uniref:hypothetical protein n=1 Tax=Sphingomonas sandaracina TaxID=3096157 RepID=UPI002FC6F37C
MRLDFKILWFENQPKDVRTQIDDIEEYLQSVGFIPHVHMEIDGSNVEALGRQQEAFDDFDLVVVDYDLGDDVRQGDWVAEHVRRHFGFTDIIFYSGKRPGDLRDLVCKKGIDGVYCFNRPDLTEKLALHIDEVVKRLSRLEAMRGLSMGVVGKCDDEFSSIIRHLFETAKPDWQKHMESKLDEVVENGLDAARKQYDKKTNFHQKLESRAVTSFHLWTLVRSFLGNNKDCAGQLARIANYNDEVLDPRNRLAHATERRDEKGWTVHSAANPPITKANFAELRVNLATHLETIREIGPILGVRG